MSLWSIDACVTLITLLASLLFIGRALKNTPRKMRLLCMGYVVCLAVITLFSWLLVEHFAFTPTLLVVTSICSIVGAFITPHLLHQLTDIEIQRFRAQKLSEFYTSQQNYFAEIRNQTNVATIMQNNIDNFLDEIHHAIEKKDLDSARTLMANVDKAVASPKDTLCKSQALNALLTAKQTVCQKLNIPLRLNVSLSTLSCKCGNSSDELSDIELVAIVGNLLDNAITATQKIGGNKYTREIVATISYQANCLFIEVQNPYDTTIGTVYKRARGLDKHGWGLAIVDRIASQHDGKFSAEGKHGLFTARVVVPLEVSSTPK